MALALHSLEDEDFLIIEPKKSKDDQSGYVQFAGFDQDGIRAEVSSEQFCKFPLGKKKSRKILHHLGWNDPTYVWIAGMEPLTGSCNYYIDAKIGNIDSISSTIVDALRYVMMIGAPYQLKYHAFSNIRCPVHFRSLRIDSEDKLNLMEYFEQ